MEKIVRNKRKCVTIIKGLDMFGKLIYCIPFWTYLSLLSVSSAMSKKASLEFAGIKLSDASKKLGKKFASGASVVKVSRLTIHFQSDTLRSYLPDCVIGSHLTGLFRTNRG